MTTPPTVDLRRLLLVAFGSALGGAARYAISLWITERTGPGFPYATLLVNALGSFLLGLFMFLSEEAKWLPLLPKLALTTGFFGGFTTYSTFSFESMRLIQKGEPGLALTYVVLTTVACIGGCALGWALGKAVGGG
ncbi:MAG: fluoride efflux transporter CrcB [Deltaproteobacteria bacterium]|nr:fluoride efflux transporter CrcB [Deltaproteobacteria bacterium]